MSRCGTLLGTHGGCARVAVSLPVAVSPSYQTSKVPQLSWPPGSQLREVLVSFCSISLILFNTFCYTWWSITLGNIFNSV